LNERSEPKIITKSDPTRVVVEWADGHKSSFSARALRQMCPCAGCVDEMSGRRTLDTEAVPHELTTRAVALVGNYAITIQFSDGHGTGIYPFRMLREADPAG
jgi:DUF971 family protein